MPAEIKDNGDGTYQVRTPNRVHSKRTSKKNAEAQVRLLNAIDHGFVPDKNKQGK